VLQFKEDNEENALTLYMLGKSHAHKAIRPWQYSVFIQTLVNTISSRLGTAASSKVMEGWVNLFAYVLKVMLPPAIKDQVVEAELYINTSSEFAQGKIAEEVAGMEEVRDITKKMKSLNGSASVSGQSSVRSSVAGTFRMHSAANAAAAAVGGSGVPMQ
jgi:hypothetical protein